MQSCSHYPYIRFLKKTGLNIGLIKIKWFTTAFNSTLLHLSTFQSKFLLKWFSLGVFVTLLLIPLSIVLLIMSIADVLRSEKMNSEEQTMILEPMVCF